MIWLRRSGNWIEQHPLLFALGISLAVHVVLFSLAATVLGVALLRDPELLKQIAQSPEKVIALTTDSLAAHKPQETPVAAEQEIPLFIEVDPSTAVLSKDPTGHPENSKYYAAYNTLSANPDTRLDTDRPKIEGQQKDIIRAFDAGRSTPKALTPQPATVSAAKVEAEPVKSSKSQNQQATQKQKENTEQTSDSVDITKQARGDTEKLRPAPATPKNAPEETKGTSRPKSLAVAKMKQGDARPSGRSVEQEGGVKLFNVQATLGAKGTALGIYVAKMSEAIKYQWFSLLDRTSFSNDRHGRVVIAFRLHSNGKLSDVRISEADKGVGDLLSYLCMSAVMDPAPYEKWPDEFKRTFEKDYVEGTFTFYY